jgi:hypothetical protein
MATVTYGAQGKSMNLNLWWAAALTDDAARNILLLLNPAADAAQIYWKLEQSKKDAWTFGVCLNEFVLRNSAAAASNARAAWSEVLTQDSAANPNINYPLDLAPFDLLASEVKAGCLKQLFLYARAKHGDGRLLRRGALPPYRQ